MSRDRVRFLGIVVLACGLAACGDDDDSRPRSTPTATVAATATVTAVPPTATTAASTATATAAPSDTASPQPTATVPPSSTPTPDDTATATPTNTQSIADELNAVGLGRHLDITPTSMTSGAIFDDYRFDPAAERAICLRGGEYRVLVHHGTNDKVLLYLEGGGACWNYQTCWVTPFAKMTADPFPPAGILDTSLPDNPFRDWNIVYAPYCDGSVFGGDNVVDYNGDPAFHTYHHGLQNVSAAVALMREQFPDPSQIVVAGSSAGGYGTFSGYGVTRVAYPDTEILTLDDSGPGLQNVDDVQGVQDRLTNWKYADSIPTSCENCSEQIAYLTEWGLQRDPTLRVGYYSSLQDEVIRAFLGLSAEAYEALLREVTGDIHSRQPERFKRFFVQGHIHTVLELPTFYTVEIAGTSIRDWTADFLTGGAAWQDIIEGANPFKNFSSPRYAGESLWMCRPDLTTNQCFADLDATAIEPDNTLVVEPHTAAETEPDYDCFYVYPTVDLSGTPGNHTDFSDISYELDPLLSQAARFNGSCRIFAPLYRQVTIGTYLNADPNRDAYFDLAYSDVEEAFRHYMGQYNNGRNFVIMGHSQGTAHTTRLLQELIDPDPELRKRLIAALLIGGGVTVPDGQSVGGTFQNLPLCTAPEQTGCVIAYRSYARGYAPTNGSNVVDANLDTACTNPASLGGGKASFAGTFLPLHVNNPAFQVGTDVGVQIDTPFAVFHDFYSGECVKDDRGKSYLEIGIETGPGDLRVNPIPFDNGLFTPGFLGTHVLDYNFAVGDLIALVQKKAAALKAAQAASGS